MGKWTFFFPFAQSISLAFFSFSYCFHLIISFHPTYSSILLVFASLIVYTSSFFLPSLFCLFLHFFPSLLCSFVSLLFFYSFLLLSTCPLSPPPFLYIISFFLSFLHSLFHLFCSFIACFLAFTYTSLTSLISHFPPLPHPLPSFFTFFQYHSHLDEMQTHQKSSQQNTFLDELSAFTHKINLKKCLNIRPSMIHNTTHSRMQANGISPLAGFSTLN